MPFRIETKMIIYQGDDENNWWYPEQRVVEGRVFFSFSKWAATFVKQMTGRRLDLRAGKESGSVDVPFFQTLLDERQLAANAAVTEAMAVDDAEETAEPKKKRAKKQKVKACIRHKHLAPEVLNITVNGRAVSVLYEGTGTFTIWMELTVENLEWLQENVTAAEPKIRKSRSKAAAEAAE